MKNRAYLRIDQFVSAAEGNVMRVRGTASTPKRSRTGLVLNPQGATFKLPLPLLWQHDSDKPVGTVTQAKVTKSGITFEGEIPIVKEAGVLKDRLDEAMQSLKYGLVSFVSVGLQANEQSVEYDAESDSMKVDEWEWLELSFATIPANSEAGVHVLYGDPPTKEFIQSIIDEKAPAASGQKRGRVVTLAGVSASKVQETTMNIAEQIKAYEAKRVALSASMEEIMTQSASAGETLDAEKAEKYEEAKAEITEVDKHLVRLRDFEKLQSAKATPVREVATVQAAGVQRGTVRVTDNLPQGIEFARYAMCLAKSKGDPFGAIQLAQLHYPDQPRIRNFIQAQVAAGTTTHITWAAPLAQPDAQFVGDFVEYLRPATILGKFGANGIPALRRVPFNVTIGGQTAGGDGYWVGEGSAKPLTKFAYERTSFPYTKCANIAVITEELLRFSNPSAEALVRDSLRDALVARMDIDFVDPANSGTTDVKPASVTNSATPVVSSGTDADAVRTDVVALMTKFIVANITPTAGVWLMPATVALNLSMMRNALGQPEFPEVSMTGGRFAGLPVIVSEHIPNVTITTTSPNRSRDIVILMNTSDVWYADDGEVTIDASREVSLEMDTGPSMKSSGSGSPQTSVESAVVSMWQTNSIAIKAERWIHWKKRRAAAVQYLTDVAYNPTIS